MKICGLLIALTFSCPIFSQSLDEADALFDARGADPIAIEKATAAYEALLSKELSVDDRIYTVEQIGRLQSYRAQMISEKEIRKRKPHFARCLKATETISPAKMNGEKTIEFLYWYGSCLAQWSQANGITQSLSRSQKIHDVLMEGRRLDPSYHGGGFDRMLAGLFSKLPFLNPFGPNGSLKVAGKHIKEAIQAPAHDNAEDPEYLTGQHYYESYHVQAEILIKSGKKKEAREVLDAAIKRIDSGDYSQFRKPESLWAKKRLQELRP